MVWDSRGYKESFSSPIYILYPHSCLLHLWNCTNGNELLFIKHRISWGTQLKGIYSWESLYIELLIIIRSNSVVGWEGTPKKWHSLNSWRIRVREKQICNNVIWDKGSEQGVLDSQEPNKSSKIWRKGMAYNDRQLPKGDKEINEHTLSVNVFCQL